MNQKQETKEKPTFSFVSQELFNEVIEKLIKAVDKLTPLENVKK